MVSGLFEGGALAPFSKSGWQSQKYRRRISSLRNLKESKNMQALFNWILTCASRSKSHASSLFKWPLCSRKSFGWEDFMPHEVYIRVKCMYTREVLSVELHYSFGMCDTGDTVSSVVPLLLHINTIVIPPLCDVLYCFQTTSLRAV